MTYEKRVLDTLFLIIWNWNKQKRKLLRTSFFELDYQDSNLEKQDQNLLCYHYTIVQSFSQNHPF